MSRSTVSSFWKEHASATLPGYCSSSHAIICGGGHCSTSEGGVKQHLFQRVAAQPEAERLERDHFLRRDVAEVDVRAEVLHEPRLARLRRRLEDEIRDRDLVRDLVDQARAHVAVLAEDPRRAALSALRDHLPDRKSTRLN